MSSRSFVLGSLLFVSFFGAAAHAQSAGVVNLRVNQTTAQGSLIPVLTWSTNPTARSCTASGGWSGAKAPNGTQTLGAISATTTYRLTCTWGTGTATLRWTAPTANTNGSPLTNLASFKVVYGTSQTSLNQTYNVADITRTSATIDSLAPGRWYFAMRAVNTSNLESANSNVAQKDVTGSTVAASQTVTITAVTTSLRVVARPAYDVVTASNGTRSLGREIGYLPIGSPCISGFTVGSGYYGVNRYQVRFLLTSRSNEVVALCRRP